MNATIGIKLSDLRGTSKERMAKAPNFFTVLFHNDPITPVDIVIGIVEQVFNKSKDDATAFVKTVEKTGSGAIGRYTREIAEVKVDRIAAIVGKANYPLRCEIKEV